MAFPDGWTTRRPTLDDLPAILELMRASDIAATGEPETSADDIKAALTSPHVDPARDCWLAYQPDGRLGGWAYIDNENGGDNEFVEVYVHPDGGAPSRATLIDLLVRRVAERATERGFAEVTAKAGALPAETDYIAEIQAAGFEFVKRFARMRRSLDGVTPTPLPAGVTIRLVRPDDDEDLRLFHRIYDTGFRDAYDYQPRDYDSWRTYVAGLTTVSWDEWFIAEVDGVPAGILMSADQQLEQNEGWIKNLAVLREFRKRGVGGALLRHAFTVYAAKGRTQAGLGVDLSSPTGAANVYLAAGMTAIYEADIFEQKIKAA
ncbi:Ribosomal protein S18 acetylase RimI [Asanoa hainanensis]|uniref:Ribosomal protein S18 acetylase RimI n=1 Tax=Asanoa hainanensis TaxID=560556 RepID=A0A239KL85_9ACTN|nr:GNAT family N-acetyltransferase [Asanoa hainanensis]SNT18760.1 Ribosomal protein S18 acetylase RimI [Asanoa hainanensis]